MRVEEVLSFLKDHGNENNKEVLLKHGAREPFFGTRIGDMKPLAKQIRHDHQLALELWETGNSDAMYFAGLIADPGRMSRAEILKWAESAYWYLLSECSVAWVAAESPHAFDLARSWIDDRREMVATAGWATWCSILATRPNEEIDTAEIEGLLKRVESTIDREQNRVRYSMNEFVICAGAYIPYFTEAAKALGDRIGKVEVDMSGTACKVPVIRPYIEKIESRNGIGKKRKRAVH